MPNPTNKDLKTTITQEEMDEADFDPEIQKAGDELLNGLEERETIYLNEGEASEEEQPKEFDLEEDGKKLVEFLYGEDNLSETVYVNPKKQEEEQPKEFDLEEERKKLDRFWRERIICLRPYMRIRSCRKKNRRKKISRTSVSPAWGIRTSSVRVTRIP